MAASRDAAPLHWIDPEMRGIFPLADFHISKSLQKTILKPDYQASFNHNFEGVVTACSDRDETWINADLHSLYMQLHDMGHAHSQEIWDGETLVGGVFGVTLGQAFFGESMFSRRRDGSKLALAWLVDRLVQTGFSLFDTQFITPHLKSLGAIEIDREDYQNRLGRSVNDAADLTTLTSKQTAYDVIQRNTQTS